MAKPAEGQQWNDESDWIHDWDYKRILPEYPKRRSSAVSEMSMDIDVEGIHPLPVQKPSAAYDKEIAIFWSRIPKEQSDTSSEISDDTEFHAMDFHELNDDLVAFVPESRRSSNDLTAFNKPPPFSWDQQQTMDDAAKDDVDSSMSPLQHKEESKYYPSGANSDLTQPSGDAMNVDESAPGMPKSPYPQQLLKDVVKHPRHSDPPQKLPPPPKGQQKKLLKEMRHSYQERRPRQELPTPPQEQQKLLQEMRHTYSERGICKKKVHGIDNRQQQQLGQRPHPASARAHPPQPRDARSPLRKDASMSMMSPSSSPISVSEIFSADLSQEDYHAKVRELTEKNLFQRQQNLLQESMKRTLESRRALRFETSWPQEYERGDKLMQVLQQVDSTSLKISQTYHLKIGFGAA
ncbi:MAG: hypothetical protein SGBAC_003645 [Bacillariaceae sp.]